MATTAMVYRTVGARAGRRARRHGVSPPDDLHRCEARAVIHCTPGDSGIGELRDMVIDGELASVTRRGEIRQGNVREAFRHAPLGCIEPERIRPLKVIIDVGAASSLDSSRSSSREDTERRRDELLELIRLSPSCSKASAIPTPRQTMAPIET
jgi:hypothetical protein